MSAPTLDDSAAPAIGSRLIGDTGVVVSPIALDGSIFGWASGVRDTADLLDRFRHSGGNLVSTADHYSGGRSEVMIGAWLRTVTDRSSVVVATEIGGHPDAAGLSQRSILRAVESSLDRLGTDYIDFLSFDGEHPQTPLDETLEAVDRLVREGKVRFLAASCFSPARIDEVAALAERARYPRFHAVLASYSLMERREYEAELEPIAARLGRGGLARQPLADGYLTGRFRSRDEVPESIMFTRAAEHIGRRGTRIIEALERVAKDLESTPTRVALAWVLLKPGIAAALLRARDGEQLADALLAVDLRLTRQHVAQLDKASAH